MKRIGLFCFLMIFVAGTVIAGEKAKGKAKGKVKNDSKQDVGYSIEPIKLDALKLPKNYKGHNLSLIYNALLERGFNIKKKDEFVSTEMYNAYTALESTGNIKKKDEFETTSEYEKKLEADKNKPLIGKTLGINDIYAFSMTPESTYDADNKLLSVAINRIKKLIAINHKTFGMSPAENISGVWGPTIVTEGGTYVGTNSYGAKLTIRSSITDVPVLAFENDLPFKTIAKRQELTHNLSNGQTIDSAYRAVVDSYYENKINGMEQKANLKQMKLDEDLRTAKISKLGHIDQSYAIKKELLNEKKSALSSYYYDLVISIKNIAPPVAKQIKDNIAILILFKLKEPYRNFGVMQFKPTIKNPEDATFQFKNVHADIKEIWIYNKVTGEVLSKTKASVSE